MGGGGRCHVGDFGVISHINRDYRVQSRQISTEQYNARIRTEFCVGEGEVECVGGGHRRAVVRMVDCLDIFKVKNGCIRL